MCEWPSDTYGNIGATAESPNVKWPIPMPRFRGSRLKVERADKHIADINSLLEVFIGSDFYDLTIDKDFDTGENILRCNIKTRMEEEKIALIIGDALHNLRSALDLLYYETVGLCNGTATKWTRFPFADTRDQLVGRSLNPALEKKQITRNVYNLILNIVKPYEGGNVALWTLDDLNITDKHQLLIPVFKLMMLRDVRFEDEQHRPLPRLQSEFFMSDPGIALIDGANGLNITVKDKGRAAADILLAKDLLLKIQAIVPTLRGITEEVTNTIETFDILFDGLLPILDLPDL
jgi:hypothetical protein